ncbi:hypothetical protein ACQVA2_13785 [Citrobacter sp. OP27]
MNINKQFDALFSHYDKMAGELLSTNDNAGTTAESDPLKFQWAKQEGFDPKYDPNSNQVVWTRQPQGNYNVPDLLKLRGSMSPETMAETYPMFGLKGTHVDELLQEIYQNVLDGKITHQRGEELCYQLALDTYDEAKKQGKAKGAAAKSSSVEQTAANAAKGKKIVEAKQ